MAILSSDRLARVTAWLGRADAREQLLAVHASDPEAVDGLLRILGARQRLPAARARPARPVRDSSGRSGS